MAYYYYYHHFMAITQDNLLLHCWLGGRKGIWSVKKNGGMVEVGIG